MPSQSTAPARRVLYALDQRGSTWRQTGDAKWIAQCPAHDDSEPSLSISAQDGKTLIHCFAGCEPAAVLDALDLSWEDLYTEREPESFAEGFVSWEGEPRTRTQTEARRGVRIAASAVTSKPVEWLIPNLIPLGAVTVLAGDPKLGKSALSMRWAASLSRQGIASLIASAEDSFADVIKPRLVAAGADLHLVSSFEVEDDAGRRDMSLPADISLLAGSVRNSKAKLVVVDPLNAHIGGAVDTHRDHHVRLVMAPLSRMAEGLGVAVLVIAHLNKSTGGNALYRVGGSIGTVAAARSLLAFGRNPELPPQARERYLVHLGSNHAALQATEAWRLDPVIAAVDGFDHETVKLTRVGESDLTADDLFRTPSTKHELVCEVCGQTFESKRSDAKTCSARCRKARSRGDVTDKPRSVTSVTTGPSDAETQALEPNPSQSGGTVVTLSEGVTDAWRTNGTPRLRTIEDLEAELRKLAQP